MLTYISNSSSCVQEVGIPELKKTSRLHVSQMNVIFNSSNFFPLNIFSARTYSLLDLGMGDLLACCGVMSVVSIRLPGHDHGYPGDAASKAMLPTLWPASIPLPSSRLCWQHSPGR